MERDESRKPLLASGKVVGSYRLIFEYSRAYKQRKGSDKEPELLMSKDFSHLMKLVEQGVTSLDKLLSELKNYYRDRVDPSIALEAYLNAMGLDKADPVEAVDAIAAVLAGWLVEAAETLGIIKLRGLWADKNSTGSP